MPNVLEVQIVGDVSNLEKSLKQAESLQAEYTKSIEKTSSELKESITITNGYKKAIDDLNKEYKDGSINSKEYSKQLANLKRDEKESTIATADLRKELANLKREQKDVGGSFDTASKKVANGGNALMQFSRIAQDAPFGIMGIGNNITATVEAFGHLQKSSGSTGAALKAVAGSMLGSGGILLAVSLVTTGLTYMAQNGVTVEDVFHKLTGTFDENAKALSEIGAEAAKSASPQISSMNALVDAAKNVKLSDEERLFAVRELQKEYPAYFGNLSTEAILNGNVAGAVDGVTTALIAKAKAAAFSSRIADLAEKEFLLRQEEAKVIEKVKNGIKEVNEAKKDLNKGDNRAIIDVGRAGLVETKRELANVREELNANLATQKTYTDELNKSTAATVKFDAANAKSAAILKAKEEAAAKAAAKAKKDAEIDVTPQITAIPKLVVAKSTDEQNDKLLKQTRDLLSEDLNRLKTDGVEVNIPFQFVSDSFNFSDYAKKLEQARKDTQIFSDGAGAAIGVLGNQIAAGLQTGNAAVDAFTGSIIQSLADIAAAQLAGLVAQQFIATKEITTSAGVSTAKGIESATKTAAASGPAAAFVLPALVGAAIGFIAASFAGIKFAHGGIVPGGSYTGDKIPAMLNSGEAVMNSQQQANTLMAIANGNSNALQSNRKSGTFNLETKLRGSDILLALKREENKR